MNHSIYHFLFVWLVASSLASLRPFSLLSGSSPQESMKIGLILFRRLRVSRRPARRRRRAERYLPIPHCPHPRRSRRSPSCSARLDHFNYFTRRAYQPLSPALTRSAELRHHRAIFYLIVARPRHFGVSSRLCSAAAHRRSPTSSASHCCLRRSFVY